MVLLVKEKGSGKSGWILQFCASTTVCTAGVENRDLAFRTLGSSLKTKNCQKRIGFT